MTDHDPTPDLLDLASGRLVTRRILLGAAVWLLAPALTGAVLGLLVAALWTAAPGLVLTAAALAVAGVIVAALWDARPRRFDGPSRGRHPSALGPVRCLRCPDAPLVGDMRAHSALVHDRSRVCGVEDRADWGTLR